MPRTREFLCRNDVSDRVVSAEFLAGKWLEIVERRMRGVFRIRRGGSAPSSSEVSVQFNGDWYWIASGDRASKQIFSLVRDLFDLQVKTVSEQGPVLTVPVGR